MWGRAALRKRAKRMFVQIGHGDVRKGQAPVGSSGEFVETSLRPEWANPLVVDPKP
jgi:hypothetical protein